METNGLKKREAVEELTSELNKIRKQENDADDDSSEKDKDDESCEGEYEAEKEEDDSDQEEEEEEDGFLSEEDRNSNLNDGRYLMSKEKIQAAISNGLFINGKWYTLQLCLDTRYSTSEGGDKTIDIKVDW